MAPPSKRPSGAVSLETALEPGAMLKSMRDLLGLSQESFAAKVGLKRQQISAYENGHYSPNIGTLADIAARAGVDLRVTIKLRGSDEPGLAETAVKRATPSAG